MNQYGSVSRSIYARNILTGAIDPPNLVQVIVPPHLQFLQAFQNVPYNFCDINLESNFNIRKFGLFANFAGGLVYRNPDPRMTLKIIASSISGPNALTGTITQSGDMITGIGTLFNTELFGNDLIRLNNRWLFVREIYSDVSAQVSDYQTVAIAEPLANYGYTGGATIELVAKEIGLLNYMYENERFAPIALLPHTSQPYIVYAQIEPEAPIDFLTTTISPDFSGEMVLFDAMAEFDITEL
jgi:hypothetical protein